MKTFQLNMGITSNQYKIIFTIILALNSCQDVKKKTKTTNFDNKRGFINSVIINVDEGLHCSTCENMTGAYIEYVLPYFKWDSLIIREADNYLINSVNDTVSLVLKRLNGDWISSYNIPYTIKKKEKLVTWFKIDKNYGVVLSQIEEELKNEIECKSIIMINAFCTNNNRLIKDTLKNYKVKYYFNNKRIKESKVDKYIDSLSPSFYINKDDKYEQMMKELDNL